MLFPLNYHREIESDIGGNGESEKLLTTEQIWDDVTSSDLVDQPIYLPPMTTCKESMSSLIIQFLFLQASCTYNFVCDLIETGAHFSSY